MTAGRIKFLLALRGSVFALIYPADTVEKEAIERKFPAKNRTSSKLVLLNITLISP